ncbi:MAG: type VI secretion lipoprotein TssJ [Deltaproteobacteria bacterium]|nr:type VI secretion lipoprotein TssJ [Deltaproteobacteria bacterium]
MKKLGLLLAGIILAGCGGGAATTPGMSGTASSASKSASTASSALSAASISYTGSYPYEREAVRIHLKADPRLNLFDATAHTLFICVYHLRDPNGFNQLLDETDGISKLLECARFDPSVMGTRKIVVQPGGEVNETVDRPEGAKYVALVAGYSRLRKEDSVRLYPVPIIEKRIGWSVRSTAMPGPLAIDLFLGPDAIEGGGGR